MRHIILAINAQGSYYLGYEGDVAHSVMTVTVILLIAWCYYSACNTNKVDVPIMTVSYTHLTLPTNREV